MKWYLDEDLSSEVARQLRRVRVDAVSSHEVGMNGSTDDEQLARASSDERILVTFNARDFIPLAARWYQAGRPFTGIALLAPRRIPQTDVGGQVQAILLADASHLWPASSVRLL
ncbi:DUF5615 family PIN-like protein [Limnochorda pilosa]|uniref:DUF5615 domain-containing protein n=1 Tax=Limnochorda pilosa TaxID=1555112 RepID=A0A0K2SM93_LIMPI|nr:DUF5615 family PIN-like protein [Limnochorda pilosa]BAS28132.1 hypothetical protein LIP_2291 [Limnochorda pilosa]